MMEKHKKIIKLAAGIISLILLFTMAVLISHYNSARIEMNSEPVFINNSVKTKKYVPEKEPEKRFEEEKVPPQSDVNVPEIG